jgi:Na+/proline symporter
MGLARLGERGGGFTSSINEISQVVLSLSGVILVVMLAAVLTRWATANAATAALVVGLVVGTITPYQLYFNTPVAERISFGWVGIPGIIVTAVVLLVVSLVENAWTRKPTHNG